MITLISYHNYFLILLILLTSTGNSAPDIRNIPIVTNRLIDMICSKTSNLSLCRSNLKPLKGRTFLYNPILTLAGNTMGKALSRANGTLALTWDHYRGISVHKPELRIKYYNCFLKYKVVMNNLGEANRYMCLSGDHNTKCFIKRYVSAALDLVISCDKELMRPPREQSAVLEANRKLEDLCSVILAISNLLGRKN